MGIALFGCVVFLWLIFGMYEHPRRIEGEPVRIFAFGLEPKTAYHLWIDDGYVGLEPTWYPPGILSFDVGEHAMVRFVAFSDTTISDVGPTRPTSLITINPVPTSGILWVRSLLEGELRIYDVAGRLVHTQEIPVGTTLLSLPFPSGVYYWNLGRFDGRLVIVR